MLVENEPNYAGEKNGDEFIEIMEALRAIILGFGKFILSDVVFYVIDLTLLCAPTEFEAAQAFIVDARSAKIQTGKAFPGVVADRFPHNKIVSPQVLKGFIRGAKFVDG